MGVDAGVDVDVDVDMGVCIYCHSALFCIVGFPVGITVHTNI
jgi:hypothetical protein